MKSGHGPKRPEIKSRMTIIKDKQNSLSSKRSTNTITRRFYPRARRLIQQSLTDPLTSWTRYDFPSMTSPQRDKKKTEFINREKDTAAQQQNYVNQKKTPRKFEELISRNNRTNFGESRVNRFPEIVFTTSGNRFLRLRRGSKKKLH